MSLSSAIMGAIAIVICVLPFIMLSNSKKKRENKFLESLSKMAAQNKGQIDKHEIVGGFGIGIDKAKNFVYFHRLTQDKVVEQTVDLDEIQSSKVINRSRTIRNKDGNQRVIDRLELSFIPTTKSKPEIKLEFFNSEETMRLHGELQSIEKWSNLINDRLKHMK